VAKRMSTQEVMTAVNAAFPAGQSEVDSGVLREAMTSQGNADAIRFLRDVKNAGLLRGYVRLNPDGTTTHMVAKVEG
jgi:hypothetical protein